MTSVTNKRGSATLSQYSYSYYLSGNHASETDNTGYIKEYQYDTMGRLTQEVNNGVPTAYSFDDYGNRVRKETDGSATDYFYGKNNLLQEEITESASNKEMKRYEYDPNGNTIAEMVEKQTPGEVDVPEVIAGVMGESEAGGSLTLYRYDPLGRLSGMKKSELAETYAYNADGLRVSKTSLTSRTDFVWDGSQMIRESCVQTGQNDVYVRGLRLISRGNEQYVFNGRGDVTQLVNGATGAVLQNYRYDAFGNQQDPNPDDTNPFRYNAEYFDKATGQYYLRARYYAPSNGRFMSEDVHWNVGNMIYGDNPSAKNPIPDIEAIIQSSNLYVYCGNNPVFML